MDTVSADSTNESNSEYPEGIGDDSPPSMSSDGDLGNQGAFQSEFDVTVGRTLMEDKSSGEEMIQFKAICGGASSSAKNSQFSESSETTREGESAVSDSVMDAVMGAIAKSNGGELP
jgi:hypothetical protein